MKTNKQFTDPTYLRSIYDGLSAGSINKDNSTALPTGLVGIYEEALPPASNVNERKKFLEFFAVWAILKKEVSAAFVLPLLEGWTEQEVIDFIGRYSKWFNSPVSGTYILYHERLRAFVQQKISHKQFTDCNDLLVKNAQVALIDKNGNEWERYALEYLSSHILISAIETGDASDLKTLAYNTSHWNRQIEISKGFEWSKNMLNDMMLWASKCDDDEVIECALNKVDLYHLEQNDAPRIVELVAQNDIETALNRIEAFGGNDKEGLQRKFILYMLCLMELTLLDSKDKPFRKEAIEKLLKHLDDNLPVDHSVLNWNDFFPSYLMFQMACEWAELGLEYLFVYNRTDFWNFDWIGEKEIYMDSHFKVLMEITVGIGKDMFKYDVLNQVSKELAKLGKFNDALECAQGISDDGGARSLALRNIASELAKQGMFEDACACAKEISFEYEMSNALLDISSELSKQGKIEESEILLKETLNCAQGILDDFLKIEVLLNISCEAASQFKAEVSDMLLKKSLALARSNDNLKERNTILKLISEKLAKQGNFELSIECADEIMDDYYKSKSFAIISIELAKQDKIEEALTYTQVIIVDSQKSKAIVNISCELAKKGKYEDSLACARGLSDSYYKKALMDISSELAKLGKVQESMAFAHRISNNYLKSKALVNISVELAKQGNIEESEIILLESLPYAYCLCEVDSKSKALFNISCELVKYGMIEESCEILKEFLSLTQGIIKDSQKSEALVNISVELAKQGKIDEALTCSQSISSEYQKSKAQMIISVELSKQGKFKDSLACANVLIDKNDKSKILATISSEFTRQGKISDSAFAVRESIKCAQEIRDDFQKSKTLSTISGEFAKHGKILDSEIILEESIACARGIKDDFDKSEAFFSCIREMAIKGMFEKTMDCAKEIVDEYLKDSAFAFISLELTKQGKYEDSLVCARGISDSRFKAIAFTKIAVELAKQGKVEACEFVFKESLVFARAISEKLKKIEAFVLISSELSRIGKDEECKWVLKESLKYARGLNNGFYKKEALATIAVELANQGYRQSAERIILEIPEKAHRFRNLKKIAENVCIEKGWLFAMDNVKQFKNSEVKTSYLKGLADSFKTTDFSLYMMICSARYYQEDIASLDKLLQHFALHELFFTDAKPEKIQRFNRTLNIQWAIDIKNSYSANGS